MLFLFYLEKREGKCGSRIRGALLQFKSNSEIWELSVHGHGAAGWFGVGQRCTLIVHVHLVRLPEEGTGKCPVWQHDLLMLGRHSGWWSVMSPGFLESDWLIGPCRQPPAGGYPWIETKAVE